MSEHAHYYANFSRGGDGRPASACRCRGGGWLLSEVDTLHPCPDHYTGQCYPECADDDERFEHADYAELASTPSEDPDAPF